jgi:AcrR family transcriptional regulator
VTFACGDVTSNDEMKAAVAIAVVTPDDLTARARIREAAFALIADQGVHGATLRAIARRAGVSAALVNHHYG